MCPDIKFTVTGEFYEKWATSTELRKDEVFFTLTPPPNTLTQTDADLTQTVQWKMFIYLLLFLKFTYQKITPPIQGQPSVISKQQP